MNQRLEAMLQAMADSGVNERDIIGVHACIVELHEAYKTYDKLADEGRERCGKMLWQFLYDMTTDEAE